MKELFSALMYGSYASNRDNGMTHEQLISIGVGNDAMKERYELEGAAEPVVLDVRELEGILKQG